MLDLSVYLPTEDLPDRFEPLRVRAYPTPFRQHTTLDVTAARAGVYTVSVYDVLGRRVDQRRMRLQPGVPHRLSWPEDAAGLASGLYVVRVSNGHHHTTATLVLLN